LHICPICGKEGNSSFIQNLKNKSHWSLYECDQCHVQFWLPLNTQPEFQYEEDVKYFSKQEILEKSNARTIVEDSWNKAQFVRDFSLRGSNGKKLLDIGCGTGEFLFVAREMGYDVQGIDFNRHAINLARQKLGLSNVFTTDLYDFLKDKREVYDIVTAFEVIEHVNNPGSFIERAGSALKKGGYLVISTPNRNRYWGRIDPALEPWDFPYNHLLRWDQEALCAFIAEKGFKVITKKKKDPIDWFVARLGQLAALLSKNSDGEKTSQFESARSKVGFSYFHFIKKTVLFICDVPAFVMARLFYFEGRDLYAVFEKN
jgi:cyclopropane fatty-acyl-phospholipid synthase-like methyltransferase